VEFCYCVQLRTEKSTKMKKWSVNSVFYLRAACKSQDESIVELGGRWAFLCGLNTSGILTSDHSGDRKRLNKMIG